MKVLDFGISKAPADEPCVAAAASRRDLVLMGSPTYMSPEQMRDARRVDARADIWSLGVILYELVDGAAPLRRGETRRSSARSIALRAPPLLADHLAEPPVLLERVIERCLAKDPAARFQSVAELARALSEMTGDSSRAALTHIERVSTSVSGATVLAGRSRPPPSPEPPPPPAAPPVSGVVALSSCDRFRRQHEDLQQLGMEIAAKLSRKTILAEASAVRRLVARFAGKLTVHASMENEALYPRLLSHPDAAVRARAKELFDEVGSLYAAFHTYSARWPGVAAIEADPFVFVSETRELLMRLAVRMVRENDELYPLVDAAEAATGQTGT